MFLLLRPVASFAFAKEVAVRKDCEASASGSPTGRVYWVLQILISADPDSAVIIPFFHEYEVSLGSNVKRVGVRRSVLHVEGKRDVGFCKLIGSHYVDQPFVLIRIRQGNEIKKSV